MAAALPQRIEIVEYRGDAVAPTRHQFLEASSHRCPGVRTHPRQHDHLHAFDQFRAEGHRHDGTIEHAAGNDLAGRAASEQRDTGKGGRHGRGQLQRVVDRRGEIEHQTQIVALEVLRDGCDRVRQIGIGGEAGLCFHIGDAPRGRLVVVLPHDCGNAVTPRQDGLPHGEHNRFVGEELDARSPQGGRVTSVDTAARPLPLAPVLGVRARHFFAASWSRPP